MINLKTLRGNFFLTVFHVFANKQEDPDPKLLIDHWDPEPLNHKMMNLTRSRRQFSRNREDLNHNRPSGKIFSRDLCSMEKPDSDLKHLS